ncbi:amidohydrolase family protein [Arthrobacter sunyaminii]|uniref:amidohydrolase family protein n=1 Tax=Arthrobacter sunyaminii TaxID=2816859 RepID=UPI001A93BD5D|nr:amidohydrolase family protein [Arthrobacter sunyaminii]MBO0896208.1 amidohydrolase family protein [Arthrobacter sunyaminii]
MRVTDTHVHFWDPRIIAYPWLQGIPALHKPRLPKHLNGASPVEKMVVIEADCSPEQAYEEALWLQAQAQLEPRIGAVVAAVQLENEARLPGELERLRALPLVRGVRRSFQSLPGGALTSPAMISGARKAAAAGLLFEATVRSGQLRELAEFARQVPELTIVLDHLGKPPVASGAVPEWAADLEQLAALPNIWIKISGLAPEARPGEPLVPQLRPFLAAAVGIADPQRLLLGSDWPVSTARNPQDTYSQWWSLLLEDTLSVLSTPDRDAAARGNAERLYMEAGTTNA